MMRARSLFLALGLVAAAAVPAKRERQRQREQQIEVLFDRKRPGMDPQPRQIVLEKEQLGRRLPRLDAPPGRPCVYHS